MFTADDTPSCFGKRGGGEKDEKEKIPYETIDAWKGIRRRGLVCLYILSLISPDTNLTLDRQVNGYVDMREIDKFLSSISSLDTTIISMR